MFSDYFPFGMAMPKRNNINNNYRYAYQGQEKDPETGKEAFELRLWDSRIGRWLTTDPAGQHASPYLGMSNNPIIRIDPDGGFDFVKGPNGEIYDDKGVTSAEQAEAKGLEYIGPEISDVTDYIVNHMHEAFAEMEANTRAMYEHYMKTGAITPDNTTFTASFLGAAAKVASLRGAGLSNKVGRTFTLGIYEAEVLSEPLVLARYYDNIDAFAKGRYMTSTVTKFKAFDRMKLALRPSWNKMTKVAHWEVEAGATVYKGRAATQFPWVGQGKQYFVPNLNQVQRVIK